jgi:hypothetical protein
MNWHHIVRALAWLGSEGVPAEVLNMDFGKGER